MSYEHTDRRDIPAGNDPDIPHDFPEFNKASALDIQRHRRTKVEKARAIVDKAEARGRDLTADEAKQYDELEHEIRSLTERYEARDREEKASLAQATFPGDAQPEGFEREARGTDNAALGRYVQALARNDHAALRDEFGTGQATGLLPVGVLARTFELARAASRVSEAGARVFPLDEGQTKAAVQTGDPVPQWRNEHDPIAESAPALTQIEFAPQALAVITRISWELVQDSAEDIQAMVSNAISGAIASEWDRVALFGSGATPEPMGVANVPGIATTTVAGPLTYDALAEAVAAVRGRSHTPGRVITSVRDAHTLATQKDDQGRYLQPPPYIERMLPALDTTKLDDEISDGEATAFLADWSQLALGIRRNLELRVLTEKYADTGEVGVIGWMRADVQPIREAGFQLLTGITEPNGNGD